MATEYLPRLCFNVSNSPAISWFAVEPPGLNAWRFLFKNLRDYNSNALCSWDMLMRGGKRRTKEMRVRTKGRSSSMWGVRAMPLDRGQRKVNVQAAHPIIDTAALHHSDTLGRHIYIFPSMQHLLYNNQHQIYDATNLQVQMRGMHEHSARGPLNNFN